MAAALRRILASACCLGLLRPQSRCVFPRPANLVRARQLGPLPGGVLVLAAIVLAIVPLGSCRGKQASAAPPAPEPRVSRAPRSTQPPSSQPVSEPQTVTALPSPQPVPPEAVPETPGPLVTQPEERASSQPEPARPRPVPSAPPATSEATAQPETPAAPVPQLGQILSPAQRTQYNQLIDQAIGRAQERLKVVGANSARLNEEQHATLKRIQAFIQQAKDKREQDLTIAKNLADRALLLAEDLAKNFK